MRTDEYPIVLPADPPRGGVQFVLAFARALHQHGMPAHRLEEAMRLVAMQLGTEGRFFTTPTAIIASFGKPEELRTSLIRTEPGELDLETLGRLDALATQVIRRERTPEEGAQLIGEILARPPRYGAWVTVLCFVAAAAAGARLFGGGLREMAVAGFSSLLIGLLDRLAHRSATVGRVHEALSGLIASAAAVAAAALIPGVSANVATLAGVIVLLPGLTMTVAMTELSTRHLISGTSRLMNAGVTLLQLGLGVALGSRLGDVLPALAAAAPSALPAWTEGAAIVALAAAITVLLKAHPRDLGWIAFGGALAYLGARLGAGVFGAQLGAFCGAAILGMASNAIATYRNRPAVITIVPGLMLLVPGSIGFRSMESLLARDTITGVETAFSMILVAVALGAGLLIANAIVPPRKVL